MNVPPIEEGFFRRLRIKIVKNEVSSINIVDEIEARRQQILGKTKLAAKEGIVIAPSLDDFRRVLAVGDIHGFYEPLRALFSAVDYVPEKDLLIFLGDYIDRGPDSAKVLRYIMKLKRENPYVITLTGNHEAMMLNYFGDNSIRDPMNRNHGWLSSGGDPTFRSLRALYEENPAHYRDVIEFILGLDHIAAVENKFFFSHAGFYPKVSYAKQLDSMLWLREDFYRDYHGRRTAVIGHTPVQFFDSARTAPLVFPNHIIDIDTGSFLPSGRISCVDVKNKKYWQSDKNGAKAAILR